MYNFDKAKIKVNELCQKQGVQCVYACALGSRVYGFNKDDSDYDIRFIYTYPLEKYLSIYPIKKKQETIHYKHYNLDMLGYELKKFLKLLHKSNVETLEWLNSNLVFIQDTIGLRELSNNFDPFTVKHHYYNLARSYIKEKNLKGYVHALRCIFSCMYVIKYNRFPPLNLEELLAFAEEGPIKEAIKTIEMRKTGTDFSCTNDLIDSFIKNYEINLNGSKHIIPQKQIDNLFRSAIE